MGRQQPGKERDWDWDHWPGRSADDGIRHRLRGLFSATSHGTESAVEELIAERGRELELRTEQLAATVADLQRREERVRELRAGVEELLRHGSAELDDRHAQLNTLAGELARREEELAAREQALDERRSEVGAVELRRAALERREAALSDREAALERIAGELHDRERDVADQQRALAAAARVATTAAAAAPAVAFEEPAAEPEETSHLLFVAGDRYRLIERDGAAPPAGAAVELDGRRVVVARVGASPLPGDRRRCAFTDPAVGD